MNAPAATVSGIRLRLIHLVALVFMLSLTLQLPLVANPGYFSFDELQWWARADVERMAQLPWVPWWDTAAPQFRPLTFNAWLILSWAFADTPVVMHLAFVVLGSINATLLAVCVHRLGAGYRVALGAALVFMLSPFATYTHGWTATLADLLVVALTLIAFLLARQACKHDARIVRVGLVVAVVVLTPCALLAKESAVVLPILLIAACWRQRSPYCAMIASALASTIVASYLWLRWSALATIDQHAAAYAWGVPNVPARALEYLLFPFVPGLFEIAPLFDKSIARLVAAGVFVTAVAAVLAGVDRRLGILWVTLYLALLAPVLVLGISYNHYAYLASTALIAIPALAAPYLSRTAAVVIGLAALVSTVHGVQVMFEMRAVGEVQQHFHEDLRTVVSSADPQQAFSIRAVSEADEWMLQRFLNEIPSYRGTSLQRVSIAPRAGHAPSHVMQRDGRLIQAPSVDHAASPD